MRLLKSIFRMFFLKPRKAAPDEFLDKLTVARQLDALCGDCQEAQVLVKRTMIEIIEHTHEGHDHA